MAKRESGLDLLRCLALLFVITFHSFLNNGYYYEPQIGILMWIAGSFRWLSVGCIGLFLMLSGYLKSRRTGLWSCYRGLIPVMAGYFIAAVISIQIRHFVFGDVQSLSAWCTRLFNFSAVYYGWYVQMYIGLVLLMPYLNRLLESLRDKRALLGLGVLLLGMTALPGAVPWLPIPDYWRNIYPITYYVWGAIIYRLQPKPKPWVSIAAAVAMAAVLGAGTVISTDGQLSNALTWEFPDLWIAFIAICLFTALYRAKVPSTLASVLTVGAKGCYGGYLLSYLFDAWCYRLLPQWKRPDRYWSLFLCVTVPIYFASLLFGIMIDKMIDPLRQKGRGTQK